MTVTLQRPAALGQQIADILRHRIIRGDLTNGTRLTEEGLADEFSVSRGSVRDALHQLHSESLIEIHKPRGIYVTGLTDEDVTELYTLRGALEQLAMKRAMNVADDDRWEECRTAVGRMLAAAEEDDHARFLEADLDFHDQIYRLADHQRLERTWHQYRPTFTALLEVTINHDKDLHDAAADHEVLFAAMRSSDLAKATQILDAHIEGAFSRMMIELADR